MAQSNIVLFPIPVEELETRIQEIVHRALVSREEKALQERLMSIEQTRRLFNPPISKVTLHTWAKEGKVRPYRIGGRVFYKYSELMGSMTHLKKYGR
jgi:hypothetical protein